MLLNLCGEIEPYKFIVIIVINTKHLFFPGSYFAFFPSLERRCPEGVQVLRLMHKLWAYRACTGITSAGPHDKVWVLEHYQQHMDVKDVEFHEDFGSYAQRPQTVAIVHR